MPNSDIGGTNPADVVKVQTVERRLHQNTHGNIFLAACGADLAAPELAFLANAKCEAHLQFGFHNNGQNTLLYLVIVPRKPLVLLCVSLGEIHTRSDLDLK